MQSQITHSCLPGVLYWITNKKFKNFRFFAVADKFKDSNSTDLSTDSIYLMMKSQLNKFIPFIKKKLYILDSFPRANSGYIARVPGDLKNGKKIEDISVSAGKCKKSEHSTFPYWKST